MSVLARCGCLRLSHAPLCSSIVLTAWRLCSVRWRKSCPSDVRTSAAISQCRMKRITTVRLQSCPSTLQLTDSVVSTQSSSKEIRQRTSGMHCWSRTSQEQITAAAAMKLFRMNNNQQRYNQQNLAAKAFASMHNTPNSRTHLHRSVRNTSQTHPASRIGMSDIAAGAPTGRMDGITTARATQTVTATTMSSRLSITR